MGLSRSEIDCMDVELVPGLLSLCWAVCAHVLTWCRAFRLQAFCMPEFWVQLSLNGCFAVLSCKLNQHGSVKGN